MANKTLSNARAAKKDEFYTRFEDINWELQHYTDHFKDKIIYCCCDDGNWSNFWKFFYINFEAFGLKRLIATSYHDGIARDDDETDQAYEYIYEGGYGKSDYVKNNFMEGVTKIKLEEKGDFRSNECKEIFKKCDIVVTNPPFSLFREFIAQLEELGKKYIVWGNTNAVTYKEIFPLIKNNKLWAGFMFNKSCLFQIPDWYEKYDVKNTQKINDGFKYAMVPSIAVFTNLDIEKRHTILECYSRYNPKDYPKYDNYDAIECGSVKDIPCDYVDERIVDKEELDRLIAAGFEVEVLEEINE